MALGYEGLAKMMVGSTEDLFLCTGASIPKARARLESSSGYGGQIKNPVAEIGIGTPRNYDWEVFSGSVNFEVTRDLVLNQLKPWLFDRQKKARITLQSRKDNVQRLDNCYWNNITMTAASGSAVTGSIGFVALKRDLYVQGGGYIANKTGGNVLCNPGVLNVPLPLNPNSFPNMSPVPFWNSKVTIDGNDIEFVTWTLNFSQEVVKFFACEANVDPVEPKFMAVGPMTAQFTGDYMFVETTPTPWDIPDLLTTLTVAIAGAEIKLETLELTTDGDDVRDQNAPAVIAVDYSAYELVA